MKKTFIFLATMLLVFSGCQNEDDSSEKKQEQKEIILSQEEKEITEKYTDFAFRLFKQVNLSEKEKKNWVISPYSISQALSMLCNGAEGNTLAEMKAVLGLEKTSMEAVNKYHQKMSVELQNLDDQMFLPLFNSIWVDKDVQLNSTFVNVSGSMYDAEVSSLDFSTSDAVNAINDWCVMYTQNRNMRIVDEISQNTQMLLANALVFKGCWDKNIFLEETVTFTNEDGTQVQLMMMNPQYWGAFYAENECFSIAELPYGNEAFSMVILLPNEGKTLSESISELTASNWMTWSGAFEKKSLKLRFPRFNLEYKKDLSTDMMALGVKDAFNPEKADFSGISASSMALNGCFQAYRFRVDEGGIVEESVTMSEGSRDVAPPPSVPFLVNRPFAFLIKENSTGLILFAGKISEL